MRLVLLLCLVSVMSGCRKKTSAEFYRLEGTQSVLLSSEGEDAYLSDEMAAVVAGLQALPEDVVEKPRATELAAKLVAARNRVAAKRAEQARPVPPPPNPFADRPTRVEPPPVAQEPAAVPEPADAGEPEPFAGMPEATFTRLYGSCFSAGPNLEVSKGVPATSKVLLSSAACQKRHGNPAGTLSYLFVDGGVWGSVTETLTVVDAGPAARSAPAPAPDAGEPFLRIPGAPLPEGYQKTGVY